MSKTRIIIIVLAFVFLIVLAFVIYRYASKSGNTSQTTTTTSTQQNDGGLLGSLSGIFGFLNGFGNGNGVPCTTAQTNAGWIMDNGNCVQTTNAGEVGCDPSECDPNRLGYNMCGDHWYPCG